MQQLQHSANPVNSEKTPNRPLHLTQLNKEHPLLQTGELALLYRLKEANIAEAQVGDLRIIPATAEEAFYKLNNLPEQLAKLFTKVDLSDPDEDDIEDIAPEAQLLFKKHYLLDEFIDVFYDSIETMDTKLSIRKLQHSSTELPEGNELSATRGRPLLLKLKELWAMDWSFDAIYKRIKDTGSFGLEAQTLVIHTTNYEACSSQENELIADALADRLNGSTLQAWQTQDKTIVKLYS